MVGIKNSDRGRISTVYPAREGEREGAIEREAARGEMCGNLHFGGRTPARKEGRKEAWSVEEEDFLH